MSNKSRSDAILIGVALCLLCLEVLWLLHQLRMIPIPLFDKVIVSAGREIGQVISKDRSVQARPQDSLTWYPVVPGDRVRLHDTVMTGTNSHAVVKLYDGGEVLLDEGTLVRFSLRGVLGSSQVIDLTVNQGMVRVKSVKKSVKLKLTREEVAVLPESEVVIARAPLKQETEVRVEKGSAEVVTQDKGAAKTEKKVTVAPGQAIQVGGGREKVSLVTALPLSEASPADKARLQAEGLTGTVTFSWKAEKGDILEWSNNDRFSSVERSPASTDGATVALAPGKYFWRVRRSDHLSSVRELLVLPAVSYAVQFPKAGQTIKASANWVFRWKPVPQAEAYLVELSDSEMFEESVIRVTATSASVPIGSLKPGTYYWRVQAKAKEWGDWPTSETFSFFVKGRLQPPKPKGAKIIPKKSGDHWPPEKTIRRYAQNSCFWEKVQRFFSLAWETVTDLIVPRAYASEDTLNLEFSWEPIDGAEVYVLEVAADSEFSKVLSRVESDNTTILAELPYQSEYFWRVAGRDREGEMGRFSAVQRLRPPEKALVERRERLGKAPLRNVSSDSALAGSVRWAGPSWVRLAVSGGYLQQRVRSNDFNMDSSGLPMNRYHLYLHRRLPRSEIEMGGWYEELLYQMKDSQGSTRLDIRDRQMAVHLFWKGFARLGAIPLSLGIEGQRFVDLRRLDADRLGSRSFAYVPILAGISLSHMPRRPLFWQTDIFLEAAPWGPLKGGGLFARSRLGTWNFLSLLTGELQGLVRPSVLYLASDRKTFIILEFSLALAVGGLFTDSPSWTL